MTEREVFELFQEKGIGEREFKEGGGTIYMHKEQNE